MISSVKQKGVTLIATLFTLLIITIVGVLANKSVGSFEKGFYLVLFLGLPFSLFFLFAGKEK